MSTYDDLLAKHPGLDDYLRRLRDRTPPMSDETADKLARLFAPYSNERGDAA